MIESTLKTLGLSDKEIAVYLASLKLGPAPVRRVAEAAGINRGTTYDILKSLMDQGLVSYYHEATRQYFAAEDPSNLVDLVEKRRDDLSKVKDEVSKAIPELRSMYKRTGDKPVVKYFQGSAAIKTILKDVIETCAISGVKEYYAYSSSAIKNRLYDVYSSFSKDRIKAGIKVKVLSIGPGGEERGLDERRWLTMDEGAPTYILIYHQKVATISIDADGKPLGVIIEDSGAYQTNKVIFESTWNLLAKRGGVENS